MFLQRSYGRYGYAQCPPLPLMKHIVSEVFILTIFNIITLAIIYLALTNYQVIIYAFDIY